MMTAAIDNDALRQAFWTAVERQALKRGKPALSPFTRKVAEAILEAGLLAFEDRQLGRARFQIVSAPTGSGKSTYAWALVAALIEAVRGTSAVFLCETIDQCEDTYRELLAVVPKKDLAIWTSAHDKGARGGQPRTGLRFHAKDLRRRRVAVATHATFKGRARGHLAQTTKHLTAPSRPAR
jgi:superfamily II DNA or RNA helicase